MHSVKGCLYQILCLDYSHETTTGSSSFRDTVKLAPMPDSYDLDRGLLLSVQAIQVRSKIILEKLHHTTIIEYLMKLVSMFS